MTRLEGDRIILADTMDKIHRTGLGMSCCGKAWHQLGQDGNKYTYQCECGNIITKIIKEEKGNA